jgi:tetratricopeptide (TPR) repeat protein
MYAEHPLDRLYTFLATLPNYLRLLIWPENLHMERSFPVYTSLWFAPVAAGIMILVFAGAHIIHSCRSKRWNAMSWGFLWFAAAHAPDTGMLVPMNALFLEHWMYLPSVGLFLGFAQTVVDLTRSRPRALPMACSIAALAFVFVFSVKTYDQNKIWHDPVSFYNNIFDNGEDSARAHNNLARYYSDHGQFTKAIDQFHQAIKVSDSYAETRFNLALTYLQESEGKEHIDEALENLQRSLELQPNFYRSYQTLGDIYGDLLHDKEKADFYHARAKAIFNQKE